MFELTHILVLVIGVAIGFGFAINLILKDANLT
jgi:hypothetical protein